MSVAKIAITMDKTILRKVDRLVYKEIFPNRSRAIQNAVTEKLSRMEHSRLAHECAHLDAREERALAEAGLASEVSKWPEY